MSALIYLTWVVIGWIVLGALYLIGFTGWWMMALTIILAAITGVSIFIVLIVAEGMKR
uniref:hypothetical protein n=1 Tax=Roseovarius sp. BRH_c41 TaxID=1629709 RepID=UPI000AE9F55B|nr:hypothetical protein [Roseovarius sp. BRH_c41]